MFRVWCFRHQSGEIEIFGWVRSVEQFHEMDPGALQRVQQDFVRGQKFRNLNAACLTKDKCSGDGLSPGGSVCRKGWVMSAFRTQTE